ncbi:hypothetical protein DXG03_006837, partial [Asterophora parasitica]
VFRDSLLIRITATSGPVETLLQFPEKLFYAGDNTDYALQQTGEDIQSPSLFPYALSAVCVTWRHLMSTIPIFWMNLVIFVGKDETPFSDVRQYLEWSRELFITVYVTRRHYEILPENLTHDSHEYKYARALIPLLQPHFHRMRVLSFDLLQSSSLPRLYQDFHGNASRLERLRFECDFDDGERHPPVDSHYYSLIAPKLTHLYIDGRTLLRAMNNFEDTWTNDVSKNANIHLRVSEFTPTTDDTIDLHRFIFQINACSSLKILRISNIPFTWSSEAEPNSLEEWAFFIVHFENLPAGAVEEFIRVVGEVHFQNIEITRSPVATLKAPLFARVLTIRDLDNQSDLPAFVSNWYGLGLVLHNCNASVVDAVLDMLADPSKVDEGPNFPFRAPILRRLVLENCGAFSFAKLRHLIEIRKEEACKRGWTSAGDGRVPFQFWKLPVWGRRFRCGISSGFIGMSRNVLGLAFRCLLITTNGVLRWVCESISFEFYH